MKKSFFMHTYNISVSLLVSSLLTFIFSMIISRLTVNLSTSDFFAIRQFSTIASQVSTYLFKIVFPLTITAGSMISLELVNRFKSDKITNYFKSIYQTVLLRHFLVQSEHSENEKVLTIENQAITTYNPVNKMFNRTVRKSFVDVRQDTVLIALKVPRSQQAQKLLKEMEPQIKEEISNQNPDHYFSSPIRVRNALWIEGKKR